MKDQETGQGEAEARGQVEKEAINALPPASLAASQWRLFCAVELTEEIRARAAEHIAQLRLKLPHVRAGWERAEKLHITLKFFGNVEASRTQALTLAAERAAQASAPFALNIAEAGAFPLRGQPRVLWLGVSDSSGGLARLQQSLEDECAAENFRREERPFHPHITIARLRQPAGTRQLAALHKEMGFEAMELTVREIVLMRSELGPKGSRYIGLSRHGLRSEPQP